MSFHITNQLGDTEDSVSSARMIEILRGIDPHDQEHPDVSLTHESEWCISVFASGLVVFENLEVGEPRHMRLKSPVDALSLWQLLSRGDLKVLEAQPWLAGYGNRAAPD